MKGPFGALFFAIPLRFIPIETYFTHYGTVYSLIGMYTDVRTFNGVLSIIHLIEIAFVTRNRTILWVAALNPVTVFLVSQPGDLFWLFEGCFLAGVLQFERQTVKALLVLFFTLALVFL